MATIVIQQFQSTFAVRLQGTFSALVDIEVMWGHHIVSHRPGGASITQMQVAEKRCSENGRMISGDWPVVSNVAMLWPVIGLRRIPMLL